MTEYTVKYFIKKFEAIPDDRWLVGNIGKFGGPRCALGHTFCEDGNPTSESNALSTLFAEEGHASGLVDINNGDRGYGTLGATPKSRVLNALYSKLRTAASIK